MTDEESTKYRKRVVDESRALTRDDAPLPSAGGLAFEKMDDLPTEADAGFTPIADRFFQQAASEPEFDDGGLTQLLAEQAGNRSRDLLAKAQSILSNRQVRPALLVVEEAISADPSSGEAWTLKGRCLAELQLHQAALRVFRHARVLISDHQVRILCLKLEADCARALTRATEEQLAVLFAKGQIKQASKLVSEALQLQPSNIVLLYHLANLHLRSSEIDAARRIIEEARRHVGRDSLDLIAELQRKIDFGALASSVEEARVALRQRDPARALRLLASCKALEGNEHYEGLRAHAEKKRSAFSQLLGSKHSVDASLEQQTLRWILAEEIKDADGAMRAGDYRKAKDILKSAATIDPDCGAVLYRHAAAIIADRPDKDDLKLAESLAARSRCDASYSEAIDDLARRIADMGGGRLSAPATGM